MKEAYENWNQVIEYANKVLNSLSLEKNKMRAPTSTKYNQNQQYISSDRNPQWYTKSKPLPNSQISIYELNEQNWVESHARFRINCYGPVW